jgi:hypothetical protein
MLKALCSLLIVASCVTSLGAPKPPPTRVQQAVQAADSIVWAGLDYSLVRMVGPGDFRDPAAIFPGMLDAWNRLFLDELLDRAESALGRPLRPDIVGVTARNQGATGSQIVENAGPNDSCDQTHVSAEHLAKAVADLTLESTSGVGLVFIVDRLVKPEKKGAVYLVFFDVATREVLAAERKVHKAAGFGFRNYWFRVPKDSVDDLKKMVR